MSNPKTALIAVDVQYDYLDKGVMAVPGAEAVVNPLLALAKDVDLVIASRNWFPTDSAEFSAADGLFPPHCLQKTRGAKIHSKITKVADLTVSKGMVEFAAYSAFTASTLRPAKGLEKILKDEGIERVLVGGLVLDRCVRYTALDANALGYQTYVPLDCTVAIDDEQRRQTLAAFKRAGVHVVNFWSPSQ